MEPVARAGRALDEESLTSAVAILTGRDPDLAAVVAQVGPPPLWAREPGFPTLVRIVLEQQVSLASAKAAYDRLIVVCPELSPSEFLGLSDDQLLRVGFSRQKATYVRSLAHALQVGEFHFDRLASMPDSQAREALMSLRGVGPWTAEIYLLMALGRPDAWPASDLALASAAARVKRLNHLPTVDEMQVLARPWQPWRGVAARILWHHYLSR